MIACSTSGGAEGNCDLWDITQFAWQGGPWPGGQTASYRAGGENNPYGFANDAFEARADECDATTDDAERAACYNELDTYVTTLTLDAENGLFMLPLTQKPENGLRNFPAGGMRAPATGQGRPRAQNKARTITTVSRNRTLFIPCLPGSRAFRAGWPVDGPPKSGSGEWS